MKIAIFSPVNLNQCGGLEALTRALGKAYTELGVNYTVFLPFTNHKQRANTDLKIRLLPPAAIAASCKWSKFTQVFWQIYFNCIIKNNYDLIHVHGAYPLGVILAASIKKLNIPAVLHGHAVDIQVLPELNYGVRLDAKINALIANSLTGYSHFIAANTNIEKLFVELGADAKKINLIYNGTDLNKFTSPLNRDQVREKIGAKEHEKLLISAGRNHPIKGYCFALTALAQVATKLPAFKYAIIGREVKQLLPLVQKLGLNENIILNEEIEGSDLLQVLRSAELYLLPSLLEGFPLTKSEALAAGLPIITTDTPGCRDALESGKNSLICPRTPAKFGKAIETLLTDPARLQKMSRHAKESAQDLSWIKICEQYCKVYTNLLGAV